jgi:hypothetical protein
VMHKINFFCRYFSEIFFIFALFNWQQIFSQLYSLHKGTQYHSTAYLHQYSTTVYFSCRETESA